MRFINVGVVEAALTDPRWRDWAKLAEAAREELERLDSKGRKKRIAAKRPDWSDIKEILAAVSSGKCWYCETNELRSDNPVDHFRPKNRVAEAADHEGYWWLAFDWRNYRFGCTYCNSFRRSERTRGGKADRFPLVDETTRASTPEKLKDERPILLDPTDPEDPWLLTFDGDGDAVPAQPKAIDEIAYRRAKMSIDIYHLNEQQIQKARWQRMKAVRDLLDDALAAFERKTQGDATAEQKWKDCLRDLLVSQDCREAFSAAALAELKRRRDNPVAKIILQASG